MDHKTKPGSPADVLEHYGVKGMQWGVRKKKPTSAEIHSARQRQAQRARELQRHDDVASTASSPAVRAKAIKEARRVAIELQTSEDRVTAARMTTGEKVAATILGGPLGLAVIVARGSAARATAREVDNLRTQL